MCDTTSLLCHATSRHAPLFQPDLLRMTQSEPLLCCHAASVTARNNFNPNKYFRNSFGSHMVCINVGVTAASIDCLLSFVRRLSFIDCSRTHYDYRRLTAGRVSFINFVVDLWMGTTSKQHIHSHASLCDVVVVSRDYKVSPLVFTHTSHRHQEGFLLFIYKNVVTQRFLGRFTTEVIHRCVNRNHV